MIRNALLHSLPIQSIRDYKSTNYSHKLHKKRQDFSKFPKKKYISCVNFDRILYLCSQFRTSKQPNCK